MCSIAVAVNRRFLGIAQREIGIVVENVYSLLLSNSRWVRLRLIWVGEDMALC